MTNSNPKNAQALKGLTKKAVAQSVAQLKKDITADGKAIAAARKTLRETIKYIARLKEDLEGVNYQALQAFVGVDNDSTKKDINNSYVSFAGGSRWSYSADVHVYANYDDIDSCKPRRVAGVIPCRKNGSIYKDYLTAILAEYKVQSVLHAKRVGICNYAKNVLAKGGNPANVANMIKTQYALHGLNRAARVKLEPLIRIED